MKKKFTDSIRVADPCNESWDEMTGNERVRFCSHCAKDVNNLSEMTRKEAMRLVRNSGGRLCVRYRTDPRTNQPVFARRVAAFARHGAVAGVLGASLLGANATYAQDSVDVGSLVQIQRTEKTGSASAKISGFVIDPNGAAVPYALVTLTNLETLMSYVQNATGEGFYEFKELDAGKYKLRFEAGGFSFREEPEVYLSEASELRRDGQLALLQVAESVEVRGEVEIQGAATVGIIGGDWVPGNELVEAVLEEDLDEVKARIIMRARINVRDKSRDGMSPLHAAVETGNLAIAEYLLTHGAKTNIRDSFKRTPLMMMDDDSTPEMFDLLIRHGAKPELMDKRKNNLLHHYATRGENADVARRLISYGVSVNAQNKEGVTPLMAAVEYGNVDVVKVLIESGANVNDLARDGRSVIELAGNSAEIKSLLETYGAIARSR